MRDTETEESSKRDRLEEMGRHAFQCSSHPFHSLRSSPPKVAEQSRAEQSRASHRTTSHNIALPPHCIASHRIADQRKEALPPLPRCSSSQLMRALPPRPPLRSSSRAHDRDSTDPQIHLRPNDNKGLARLVVLNLGPPLLPDVVERRGVDNVKAEEEDVRLRVAQGAEPVVVLLSSSIPEPEVDRLAVDHHVGRVVVENGRDVLSGKRVGRVGNQEARLTDGTVAVRVGGEGGGGGGVWLARGRRIVSLLLLLARCPPPPPPPQPLHHPARPTHSPPLHPANSPKTHPTTTHLMFCIILAFV